MGFGMSLFMTLIITYINTGMDEDYPKRFLKAWSIGLPIAIATSLLVISGLPADFTKYAGIPSMYMMNLFAVFGSNDVNIISFGSINCAIYISSFI